MPYETTVKCPHCNYDVELGVDLGKDGFVTMTVAKPFKGKK